jgi:hypothetical protein
MDLVVLHDMEKQKRHTLKNHLLLVALAKVKPPLPPYPTK